MALKLVVFDMDGTLLRPKSSWGLLQDLHQLHLKLHDVKPPLLGSPPRAI